MDFTLKTDLQLKAIAYNNRDWDIKAIDELKRRNKPIKHGEEIKRLMLEFRTLYAQERSCTNIEDKNLLYEARTNLWKAIKTLKRPLEKEINKPFERFSC